MAKCLLRGPWVVHTESGLGLSETVPKRITADWRAVCGKTACTVRRAGWRKPSRPLSAPARDGALIERPGREDAPRGPNQRMGPRKPCLAVPVTHSCQRGGRPKALDGSQMSCK